MRASVLYLVLVGVFVFAGNSSVVQASVTKKEQRIIALSPHSVEMLYAIGAGDRIVGTVEWSDFPEEAKVIERVGNYAGINIERVVELKPDFIIAWRSGNKSADLNKLESLGFQMVYSNPSSIENIGEELLTLGQLTGLEENARNTIRTILAKRDLIKKRFEKEAKVKVFYQLWHDPLRTVGPKSWISRLIEDCNATNVFDDTDAGYPLVSLESVLLKDPHVIIVPSHSGRADESKNIWSKWQDIQAVANQNIYHLNGDLLHRFSPRAVDGLETLCNAIHKGRKTIRE
ncbi:cobalamin-binding protein [Aliikangiella marina]|uniref:Cobalamin-binding protein n=1 Tax=Aliikangiella marina TaxID=1712262 RepID=A0A545TCQ7_9GAMM|nr:cobalamin-binding protein [Aliikangiella marina]TQV74997.1 cobalamin-binding protein [Aliikangiella marina]